MQYLFDYTVTARCHLLANCIGTPSAIMTGWSRLEQQDAFFSVDSDGWLKRASGGSGIAGYYNPAAVSESDYSFAVPLIAPQSKSGAAGVAIRVQNANNYYAFLWDDGFLGWSNPQRLIRVKDGVPSILAESNGILSSGYSTIISVTVAANRLTVRTGDSVVFNYTDTADPLLHGSYGLAVMRGSGMRFAGVYGAYVRNESVPRQLSAELPYSALGLGNSRSLNTVPVGDLLRNEVNLRRTQLGVAPAELVIYGYAVTMTDIFAQVYFDLSEPAVYSSYGNCYIYGYLKQTPRVPDAPVNLTGQIEGTYIRWRWHDTGNLETNYVFAQQTNQVIAVLPANTTSYLEPIVDDGVTVTRRVWARNSVGNSPHIEAGLFVPIINPGAVAFFDGQAVGSRSIRWVWSELQYAEEYELLDDEHRVIARLPAGTNFYHEDGLESDRYYARYLRAVRKGVYGPTVQAVVGIFSTVSTYIVPAPIWFRGEAVADHTIRWLWEYTGLPASFKLYDAAGTIIAVVSGNLRDFIEYNLQPGETYVRVLVAQDADGRISAPLVAECATGEKFEPDECPLQVPEPEFISGFQSGIGDHDDLLTDIQTGPVRARALIRATGIQETEEEILAPAACQVRFAGEGEETITKDYGNYHVTATVEVPANVRFQVQAEVPHPVDYRYKLEADILTYNCQPLELPFSGKVTGLARLNGAPAAFGQYTVKCRADVTVGTHTEQVVFTTTTYNVNAGSAHDSPDTALRSTATCRDLIAPLIGGYLTLHPGATVTPVLYWVESEGEIRAFTSSGNGHDYVRWYRTDWHNFLVTHEAGVSGTLPAGHPAGQSVPVSSTPAQDIITASLTEGYEPGGSMTALGSLKWLYASTPFDGTKTTSAYTAGVLETAPSVACFVRDISLPVQPQAASLSIASSGGMALYINGTLVADQTSAAHAPQYWNYTYNVQNLLLPGKNRIAVLVDNGHQNANSGGGYFDCELHAVVNGETIYPIRRGQGNYGTDACMWWYYSASVPESDPLDRAWYHRHYGSIDATAWRAESGTPGAVLYIDPDGYLRVYSTVSLTTCEMPVAGNYQVMVHLSGLLAQGLPKHIGSLLTSAPYAVSGPGAVGLTEYRLFREFWPWIELTYRMIVPASLEAVVFNAICAGGAQAATAANGSQPLSVNTSQHTWQPDFMQTTVSAGPMSGTLNDDTSVNNPQAILGDLAPGPVAIRTAGQFDGEILALRNAVADAQISGTYSIAPGGQVVWLKNGYVEAALPPATGVLVQFNNSDHNDGNARIYVDGDAYALFPTRNAGHNYVYICNLPAVPHVVRVETAGGGDLHIEYIASAEITGSATLPLLAEIAANFDTGMWLVKQVRAVREAGDCIIYTADGGYGYVYAYATRPSYHYNRWTFRRTILPSDGEMPLVDTSSLVPRNRLGEPYLEDDVLWSIIPVSLPEGVFLYWGAADGGIVVGKNTLRLDEQVVAGIVAVHRPLKIQLNLAETTENAVTVVVVEGDNNVFARVLPNGTTVYSGQRDIAPGVNRILHIGAVAVDTTRAWQYYGPWRDLTVQGEVLLRPDIPLTDKIVPTRLWYELSGDNVSAEFINGGNEADGIFDLLRVTGGVPAVQSARRPWSRTCGVVETELSGAAEITAIVTLPQDDDVSELVWIGQSLTPGIDATVTSVVPDETSGTARVTLQFIPFSSNCLAWQPVTKSGYYYYLGQERYLFGQLAEQDVPEKIETVSVRLAAQTSGTLCHLTVTAEVPADGEYHAILPDSIYNLFQQTGADLSDVTGFLAEVLAPDNARVSYDPMGNTAVMVKLPGTKKAEMHRVSLDASLTASIPAGIKGTGPVVVVLEDGTPLQPVCNPGDDLTVQEVLCGSDSCYLDLAYTNIDEATVSVSFIPQAASGCAQSNAGYQYNLTRFQVCGNRLKLPVTARHSDLVRVSYRLHDSFTVIAHRRTAIVKVHSNKVKPGDIVSVYFEAGDGGSRKWSQYNLNPLQRGIRQGFLKIAPTAQAVANLEISFSRTNVNAGDTAPLVVAVLATSASQTACGNIKVMLLCGDRAPQRAVTSAEGVAIFEIPAPFEEGILPLRFFCDDYEQHAAIFVAPSICDITLDVSVSKHTLYPGERCLLWATVKRDGLPVPGAVVAAQCTEISPQSATTDVEGKAVFLYTAPAYSGTFPAMLVFEHIARAVSFHVSEPVAPITVNNKLIDIPATYSVHRLGYYDVKTLASTPPERL